MQEIYFAARYPQYVACMYLYAPVINLLSCPAEPGKASDAMCKEFTELLSYRNHPLDNITGLTENNIPIILVSGDKDDVVPYDENGKILNGMYVKNGCDIQTIIVKGRGHLTASLGVYWNK